MMVAWFTLARSLGLYKNMVLCQYSPFFRRVNTFPPKYDICYPKFRRFSSGPDVIQTLLPMHYVKPDCTACQRRGLNNHFAISCAALRPAERGQGRVL